jgi:hypothetical protein
VHFVHGGVKTDDRENIRHEVRNSRGELIELTFEKDTIKLKAEDKVLLSSGEIIFAKDVTLEHDVSNNWIKTNLKNNRKEK